MNAPVYQGRLEQSGIVANVPVGDRLVLQVNAAMRRYLDPAALTIVKAGDFVKAGAY